MLERVGGEADGAVVATVARFAADRLAPGAAAREKAGRIEPELIRELAGLGLFGATTDPEWGGAGLDSVTYAMALEEVAAGDGAVSTMISVHNAPTCLVLERYGTPAQKERWLRPLATGEAVGSFALTEPGAGSDASAILTRAARRGNSSYRIDGSKQFISNARIASAVVLFAVTAPEAGKHGISCFVVSPETAGFRLGKLEEKLGQKASDTSQIVFDAMEVPEEQRIGAEGEGYRIALSTLEAGRIAVAAQSVGMARSALDCAIAYAKERKTFGRPIIEHQAVGFRLAEAKTRLEAARQLTLAAARRKRDGLNALEAACMAKLFASEAAEGICSTALQTLGGYGYLTDFPVERIWRDVRVCQIYEGTSDVQKLILQRLL